VSAGKGCRDDLSSVGEEARSIVLKEGHCHNYSRSLIGRTRPDGFRNGRNFD
jgi:hypothetical protein